MTPQQLRGNLEIALRRFRNRSPERGYTHYSAKAVNDLIDAIDDAIRDSYLLAAEARAGQEPTNEV